jgi:hypothetical protein
MIFSLAGFVFYKRLGFYSKQRNLEIYFLKNSNFFD